MKLINCIKTSVNSMNAQVSAISSIGEFITEESYQRAMDVRKETISYLPKGSLAYKIVSTMPDNRYFTEKQLWVVAFELEKNEDYCQLTREIFKKSIIKHEESKRKLKENKELSKEAKSFVKKNGCLIKDYEAFLKNGSKEQKKEFYSKRYSMESAKAFLASQGVEIEEEKQELTKEEKQEKAIENLKGIFDDIIIDEKLIQEGDKVLEQRIMDANKELKDAGMKKINSIPDKLDIYHIDTLDSWLEDKLISEKDYEKTSARMKDDIIKRWEDIKCAIKVYLENL